MGKYANHTKFTMLGIKPLYPTRRFIAPTIWKSPNRQHLDIPAASEMVWPSRGSSDYWCSPLCCNGPVWLCFKTVSNNVYCCDLWTLILLQVAPVRKSEDHVNGFNVIDLTTTIMGFAYHSLLPALCIIRIVDLDCTHLMPNSKVFVDLFCDSKPSPSVSFYPIGSPRSAPPFSFWKLMWSWSSVEAVLWHLRWMGCVGKMRYAALQPLRPGQRRHYNWSRLMKNVRPPSHTKILSKL